MRALSIVLASALSLISVKANSSGVDPRQAFVVSAGFVENNGQYAAFWVHDLKEISSDCNYRIDAKELNRVIVGLSRQRDFSLGYNFITKSYNEGTWQASNTMQDAWETISKQDLGKACDLVDVLWGDMGQQFPGVLSKD